MQDLKKHTSNSFVVPECTFNDRLPKISLVHCCEVLIDFRTCLSPPPKSCHDINVTSKVEVKIDKICGCKVLIGGVLHKTIKYIYTDCDCKKHRHIKHKDIPFSCFVDFDCATLDDTFKIIGHEIACEFSEIKKVKEDCFIKTIFIEKDILKIAVQSN